MHRAITRINHVISEHLYIL